MADFQVLSVQRTQRLLPHESIAKICGTNPDGSPWVLTQQQAIDGIEGGRWRFYVSVGGRALMVVVATSVMGNSYLKSQDDGDHPVTLLNLPDCPT